MSTISGSSRPRTRSTPPRLTSSSSSKWSTVSPQDRSHQRIQAPLPEDPLAGLASLADQARAPDQQPLREDFAKFFEAIFRDAKGKKIKLQPFQHDIIRALMTKTRVLINLFRGGGKSSLVTIAYVCWRTGNDRDIR